MKKLFLFAALMTAVVMSAKDVVVYENPFVTETSTQLNNVEQGTPAVLWTNTQNILAGTAPAVPATGTSYLQIQNKKVAGANGRNILTAPIANFNKPFTAKLSEIEADSVVWTFNYRNNSMNAYKGFDSARVANAIILIAEQEDMLTTNGYAITVGDGGSGTASKTIRLSYFTGGLVANANVHYFLASPQITLRLYWHIRVVYIPSTNTWKMGYFENTKDNGGFINPDDVTEWTDCGSVVNDTYTNTAMSHFGFLNKYVGNNDQIMYIKNFKIMAYGVEETPTGIDELNTRAQSRKVWRDGQLIILRDGVEYNVLGQSIH